MQQEKKRSNLFMNPGIPILMYHALPVETLPGLHKVHVSAANFGQQVQWLSDNGYHTITVHEAVTILKEKWACDKYVVLTFDDGFSSVYNTAYPILKKYGYTATLYLVTDVLNKSDFSTFTGFENPPFGDRPLNTYEINELIAAGWEVGAHSCTHSKHSTLTEQQLQHEIKDSKIILSSALKYDVTSYAFPFGNYTSEALSLIEKSGYNSAVSVHPGKARYSSDFRRLHRIEINADDTHKTFARKVTTGYASLLQQLRSIIRNILFSSPILKDALQSAKK
jgi:peptidoglycan/xylan/chitin deacetylase (PgdA/CDA1 family)